MSDQRMAQPTLPSTGLSRIHTLRWRLPVFLAALYLGVLLMMGTSIYRVLALNEEQIWATRQREVTLHAAASILVLMNQLKNVLQLVDFGSVAELPDQLVGAGEVAHTGTAVLEVARLDQTGAVIANVYQDAPLLAGLFKQSPLLQWHTDQQNAFWVGEVQRPAGKRLFSS